MWQDSVLTFRAFNQNVMLHFEQKKIIIIQANCTFRQTGLIPKTQQIDTLNTCQISTAASSQSQCQAQSITSSTKVNTTLVVIIITRTGVTVEKELPQGQHVSTQALKSNTRHTKHTRVHTQLPYYYALDFFRVKRLQFCWKTCKWDKFKIVAIRA